jgi:two-component system, OmpR family, sensor histidine kinase ResE
VALLGVQGALALQNATLFDEARRRVDQLRLVNEASRYATAILSLPHLSEGVMRMLAEALNFDLVGLLEITPTHPIFQAIHSADPLLSGPALEALQPDLLRLAEYATHTAEPQLENITWQHTSPEVVCVLAIPMIIADEVTGLLLVARRGTNSLKTDDLDVLEPLAAQLSTAVSNARLYEKVRKQTVALEERVARRTAEIRRQHERTEAILHSVADAVIVFDLQAQVVLTNPVARALFDKHDLTMDLGTRVRRLVAPILNGEHNDHEFTDIYELGPVTLQALAAPVLEDDLTTLGAVVVMRDISQLRELDRLKDMFVSNVSHELRTPLANLKLYLSLLEQGRPERHADYMDVMRREVERLERLISDLLQISRLRNEKHAGTAQVRLPLNLAGLIENVIRGNSARAQSEEKTLRHECETPPLPPGYGNPDQIIRALMNLVGNALAYTEAGDSIIVRSRTDPVGQKKPEWVIIEVVDTGMGIPAEELHTIFERFYRGSNVSPTISGTGLGLAIVKDIIDLHKGRIEVESTEGQGSTFRIALPVYNGSDPETLVENDV